MLASGENFSEADLPPPILVPVHLQWVWRAWNRLAADRSWIVSGHGPPIPQRIPWTTILLWSQAQEMTRPETEFLDYLIREMDSVYLNNYKTTAGTLPDDKLNRWETAED